MKRPFILMVIFFVFGALFLAADFAEDSASLTILYTGSVRGATDPIRG